MADIPTGEAQQTRLTIAREQLQILVAALPAGDQTPADTVARRAVALADALLKVLGHAR